MVLRMKRYQYQQLHEHKGGLHLILQSISTKQDNYGLAGMIHHSQSLIIYDSYMVIML